MRALLIVCLVSSVAHAKDAVEITAAKAILDAQIAAMNAGDAASFAKTFDDKAYAILPGIDEADGKAKIESTAKPWLATAAAMTPVRAEHARFGSVADTKSAWISVELVAGDKPPLRWRVTEWLTAKQPTDGRGLDPAKITAADYRVQVAHISEAIDDKALLSLAAKGGIPALPAIAGATKIGDTADNPERLARLAVAADPAATLIGSAPNEFVTGKAAVAAKLASWKGLAIKLIAGRHLDDYYSMGRANVLVGHVEITFKVAGKPVVVPYRVLVISSGPGPATHEPYLLDAVHYSVPGST